MPEAPDEDLPEEKGKGKGKGPKGMQPDPRTFHTIGILKRANDPNLAYWTWQYKCALKRILVWQWRDMQQYYDAHTTLKWVHAMQLMELDRKAQRDLILLAYSGHKGRTLANKLMFQLLSYKALSDPDYENLSSWVSHEINLLRRTMDRPPGSTATCSISGPGRA